MSHNTFRLWTDKHTWRSHPEALVTSVIESESYEGNSPRADSSFQLASADVCAQRILPAVCFATPLGYEARLNGFYLPMSSSSPRLSIKLSGPHAGRAIHIDRDRQAVATVLSILIDRRRAMFLRKRGGWALVTENYFGHFWTVEKHTHTYSFRHQQLL